MSRRRWMVVVFCLFVKVGRPQESLPVNVPEGVRVSALPEPSSSYAYGAGEDLLRRLEQAETRLGELEAQRLPAVQAEESEDESWLTHFITVHDPEIAIAREQSHLGPSDLQPAGEPPKSKKWYDKLNIRGYAQSRINEVMFQTDGSAPAQYVGDRSIGDDQSFLIRRARVIISGDVHERLYVYLQSDFASNVTGSNDSTFFAQMRDWYGDFYFDDEKVNRLRIGQSKIPFGWGNMQSSSNRVPIDRDDAIDSAVRNERDLGVFYYWTPTWAQDFFKDVLEEGLKGSGNYGVFGLGAYNGQGGSLLEQNDNLHIVSRLILPTTLASGQRMEIGIQGYYGEYAVIGSTIDPPGPTGLGRPVGTLDFTSPATLAASDIYRNGWVDKRLGGTFVWYPQPLGFQTEWNIGRGPALNDAHTAIEDQSLTGGYAMLLYKLDWWGTWFPFARYSYYQGGYKSERNAPNVDIREWEFGAEWQINPAAELTLTYLTTDRTNTTANGLAGSTSYGQFEGDVIRAQFQINY